MNRDTIHNIEHQQLTVINSAIREDLEEIVDKVVDDILAGETRMSTEQLIVKLRGIRPHHRYINAAIAMICRKLVKHDKVLVCIPNIDIKSDNEKQRSSLIRNYIYIAVDIETDTLYTEDTTTE